MIEILASFCAIVLAFFAGRHLNRRQVRKGIQEDYHEADNKEAADLRGRVADARERVRDDSDDRGFRD